MQDNTKLFEFIYESVISEGGDGDLALVSSNHIELADQFETFLKTKPHGNWSRKDLDDGDIVFWDNQESFVFSNHDHFCSFSDGASGKGYPEGKIPCSSKVVLT
jgi:hypothetical protein